MSALPYTQGVWAVCTSSHPAPQQAQTAVGVCVCAASHAITRVCLLESLILACQPFGPETPLTILTDRTSFIKAPRQMELRTGKRYPNIVALPYSSNQTKKIIRRGDGRKEPVGPGRRKRHGYLYADSSARPDAGFEGSQPLLSAHGSEAHARAQRDRFQDGR